MLPVEKMAARVLARHNIAPPFDLDKLASLYGDIRYEHFPVNADGVVVGIGSAERPRIFINMSSHENRQRFTLAHELGHIIIPWHTGTIISHLDNNDPYAHLEYYEMETEANQFAAELLMPSKWLNEEYKKFNSFSDFVKNVLNKCGVSRDAALIKIFKSISIPITCIQIGIDGKTIKKYATSSAYALSPDTLMTKNSFASSVQVESFNLQNRSYKCWIFNQKTIEETDARTWREILNAILKETNEEHLRQSINATIASKCQRLKGKNAEEITSLIINSFDGAARFNNISNHKLLPQLVIKRVRELLHK